MSKHHASKNPNQGILAAASQKPKCRLKTAGAMLGALAIAGAVMCGCTNASPQSSASSQASTSANASQSAKDHTFEDVYNDYLASPEGSAIAATIDLIKKKANETGLGDVSLSAKGNELVVTILMPSDSTPVFRFNTQQELQNNFPISAKISVKGLEDALARAGITLNGDLTMRYVCRDTAGEEVGQAVYDHDGLVSYEGPDITLTLEDLYNDETTTVKKILDDGAKQDEEYFAQTFPGSRAWIEVHGNDIEEINQLNAQSNEINVSALDEMSLGEEMVANESEFLKDFTNSLSIYAKPFDLSIRYTFQDAEGNVVASYLYNKDGFMEE